MKRRGDLGERVARKLMGEEDLERKRARVRLECRKRERGIEKLAEQMTALKKAMEAKEREEEKAEELAEKMMGGCGLPWCRGTTGKGRQYCPECKRQKEEERRRAERVGEQIANKGER